MAIMSAWSTEETIFKRIHIVMAVLFLLLSGYAVVANKEQQIMIALLAVIYLALSGFRHFYLSNMKDSIWQWMFPYAEIGAIYALSLIDASNISLPMFILITWDIVLDYRYAYGSVYSVVGYFAYMSRYIVNYMHLSLGTLIIFFIIAAVQFVLFIGFAYLAKQYSIQSRKLRETTAELNAKMIAMEEVAVLKERNRIAVEIHNTVGHKLTTALVQIEAAQLVMEKDVDEGKRRLAIIKEQVRDGLQEIRRAIHAIKAEQEYDKFEDTVNRMLEQVRNLTKIQVDFYMDDITEAKLQLKKVLSHIILESITNAIRHGHCQKMKITLTKDQGIVILSSFNDGLVPKSLHNGYGLSQMKENIVALGGSLSMKINEHGWFGLVAELPVYYRGGDVNGEN